MDRRLTYGKARQSDPSFEGMEAMHAWRAQTPEGEAWSKRMRDVMEAAHERDPTNPWFSFYAGMARWDLGETPIAVESSWKPLRTVQPDLAFETIRMLPMFARIGASGHNDQSALIRTNIASAMIQGGYEPELSTSLVWMAIHWKTPPPKLDLTKPEHQYIADEYAKDWDALMPAVEGMSAVLFRLAAARRAADNVEDAEELERRAAAYPGDYAMSRDGDVAWALYGIPIPSAIGFAITALFLIGLFRRFGVRFVPEEGEGVAPI